ncbi:MAG: sarcosine oxidase subunit gamma [Gammaproteobacteria bacterium]|nr:sarcosine oxidase subunit gamma [Gammaproteobacteria bacterium]
MLDARNPETYSAQPLSTETFCVGALSLQLLPTTGKLVLRGNPVDSSFTRPVVSLLGVELPIIANTVVISRIGAVLWRGPNEWMIELPLDQVEAVTAKLEKALQGQHISIVDITDAYSVLRLSGRGVRQVLSSGCPINLNENDFGADQCAQSHYHKAGIILRFVDKTPAFDVFVRRSETEYLWQLLQLSCQTNTTLLELEANAKCTANNN